MEQSQKTCLEEENAEHSRCKGDEAKTINIII